MKRFLKKLAVLSSVGCFALMLCVSGASAAYPDRAITMIIGFGAGGVTDIMGRSFSTLLAKELSATIVVKNVVGAGGTMGAAELAAAKPDGYTLAYLPVGTLSSQPNLRELPYSWEDLTPISLVTNNPVAVVSPKNVPWKNFKEAVELLKANPGKYFFASSGPGSSPHVSMQALFDALGVKIGHIPAKDSGSAIISINSGTTQFYADPPVIIRQFDLLGMGIFAEKRMAAFPDVPTFKEMGIDVPNFSGWHGFMGPKNLPADLHARLDAAAKKIVESSEFAEICKRTDMVPAYLNSKEFAAFYKAEYELYGKYLRQFGLKKK